MSLFDFFKKNKVSKSEGEHYAPAANPVDNDRIAKEQHELGLKYAAAQNIPAAVKCFEKAADLGYAPSQGVLADGYMRGAGVPQNTAKAIELFKKAAAGGYAQAQCNLGLFYINGTGVKRDLNEARRLLQLAADQGFVPAQINLKTLINTMNEMEKEAGPKPTPLIPEGTNSIEYMQFKGDERIVDLVIPDSVKVIEGMAFANCPNLRSVVIPGCVSVIGDYAFGGCENLESVTIKDNGDYGRMVIDINAFSQCTSLKNVRLSHSVGRINRSAFSNCNSIKEITIPKSVYMVEPRTFDNTALDFAFVGCVGNYGYVRLKEDATVYSIMGTVIH